MCEFRHSELGGVAAKVLLSIQSLTFASLQNPNPYQFEFQVKCTNGFSMLASLLNTPMVVNALSPVELENRDI